MDSEGDPMITVSAPGKIILHGEHSVVYGKRAVALSLDLRTKLSLKWGGDTVVIDFADIEVSRTWTVVSLKELATQIGINHKKEPTPLLEDQAAKLRKFLEVPGDQNNPTLLALLSFMHLYFAILPQPVGLKICVDSQLPIGAGLGSSAAYAVCVSAGLLRLAKLLRQDHSGGTDEKDLMDVNAWAFRSEQIVHGTPSGIDNSICTYGGAVDFKGGSCSPLKIPPLQVLLVNTRVPRSTKALVAGVKDLQERLPSVVEPILEALDAVADRGLDVLHKLGSIKEEQEIDLVYKIQEDLIDMNHALLCSLGVSHPSLNRLVGIANSHRLHAKLTGAGGGGFGVVVVGRATSETVLACRKELESSGYQVWATSLGAKGLTFHP